MKPRNFGHGEPPLMEYPVPGDQSGPRNRKVLGAFAATVATVAIVIVPDTHIPIGTAIAMVLDPGAAAERQEEADKNYRLLLAEAKKELQTKLKRDGLDLDTLDKNQAMNVLTWLREDAVQVHDQQFLDTYRTLEPTGDEWGTELPKTKTDLASVVRQRTVLTSMMKKRGIITEDSEIKWTIGTALGKKGGCEVGTDCLFIKEDIEFSDGSEPHRLDTGYTDRG